MGFGIDMAKAREIHKTKIRNARTPLLAALDIEFQRALETSADTSAIIAKKNALRDAPADSGIAAASDADALKAQWNTSILGTSPYS
jgi:flagellar basal body rod protein FlgB